MFGVSMPRLVICFLIVINTWTKKSMRECGPDHTHSVCACFMTPFNLDLNMIAEDLQLAVCVLEMQPCSVFPILLNYVQNVRLVVSIHHWEQKQLHSALKCQVWVVSHITEELTRVYLAEKRMIYLNKSIKTISFLDRRWMVFYSKWLIFIVLRMTFCFFSPFFLLPPFGCVWTWWTWLLSRISGQ